MVFSHVFFVAFFFLIVHMIGRIEELLDARAATPAELLETRPFDVPRAIAVSRVAGWRLI